VQAIKRLVQSFRQQPAIEPEIILKNGFCDLGTFGTLFALATVICPPNRREIGGRFRRLQSRLVNDSAKDRVGRYNLSRSHYQQGGPNWPPRLKPKI
jgi:hypothetical protein